MCMKTGKVPVLDKQGERDMGTRDDEDDKPDEWEIERDAEGLDKDEYPEENMPDGDSD